MTERSQTIVSQSPTSSQLAPVISITSTVHPSPSQSHPHSHRQIPSTSSIHSVPLPYLPPPRHVLQLPLPDIMIPSPNLHVDFLSPSPALSSSSESSFSPQSAENIVNAVSYANIFPHSRGEHPALSASLSLSPSSSLFASAGIEKDGIGALTPVEELEDVDVDVDMQDVDMVEGVDDLDLDLEETKDERKQMEEKALEEQLEGRQMEKLNAKLLELPLLATAGAGGRNIDEEAAIRGASLAVEAEEKSATLSSNPPPKKKLSCLPLRKENAEDTDETPKKSKEMLVQSTIVEGVTPTKVSKISTTRPKEKAMVGCTDENATPTKPPPLTRQTTTMSVSLLDDDEAKGCKIPDLFSSSTSEPTLHSPSSLQTEFGQETIGKRKGALKLGLVPISKPSVSSSGPSPTQSQYKHATIPFPTSEPSSAAPSSPVRESFDGRRGLESGMATVTTVTGLGGAQRRGSRKEKDSRIPLSIELFEAMNEDLSPHPLHPSSFPTSPTESLHPDLASLSISPITTTTDYRGNGNSGMVPRAFVSYSDEEPLTDSDLEMDEDEYEDGIEDIEEEEDPDMSPLFVVLSQSKSPAIKEAWEHARMILIPPKRSLPMEVLDLAKQLKAQERLHPNSHAHSNSQSHATIAQQKDEDVERTEAWIAMHAFARVGGANEVQESWNGFSRKLPSYVKNSNQVARMEVIKYKQNRKVDIRLVSVREKGEEMVVGRPTDGSVAEPPKLKNLPSISSFVASEKRSSTHSAATSEELTIATWRTVEVVNELPMAWSATNKEEERKEMERKEQERKERKEEKKGVAFRPLKWMRRGSSKTMKTMEKEKKEFSKIKTEKGKSVLLVGVDGPVLDWFYDPRPDQYSHSSFSVNLPSQMATVDSLGHSVRTRTSSIKYLRDRRRTKSRLSTSSRRSLIQFTPYELFGSTDPRPSKSLIYLLDLMDDRKSACIQLIFETTQVYSTSPRMALDDYETVYLDIRRYLVYPALKTLGEELGRAMETVVEDVVLGLLYDKLYTSSFKLLFNKQDYRLNTILASYRLHKKSDLLTAFHCTIEDIELLTPACRILGSINQIEDESLNSEVELIVSLLESIIPNSNFIFRCGDLARSSRTPQQILAIMGLTVQALDSAIGGTKLGGEDLAGLVSYVIVQSGVKDMYSLLNYTRRFTHFQRAFHEGHIHYLLATFELVLDDLISDPLNRPPDSSPDADVAFHKDDLIQIPRRYCSSIAETPSTVAGLSSRFNKSDLALASGSTARDALTRALMSSRPSPELPPPSSPSIDMRRGGSDGPGHAKRVSFDAWSLWGTSSPQRSSTPSSTQDGEDGSWIGWGRKRWSMTSNAAPYSPSTPASPEIPPLEDKSCPQNRNRRNSESAANVLNSRLMTGHSQTASEPNPAPVIVERARRPRPKSIISLSSVAPNMYAASPNSITSSRSGHRSMRSQHGPTGLRREVFAVESSSPLPPKVDHSMAIARPEDSDDVDPTLQLNSAFPSAASSPFFSDTQILSPAPEEAFSSSSS